MPLCASLLQLFPALSFFKPQLLEPRRVRQHRQDGLNQTTRHVCSRRPLQRPKLLPVENERDHCLLLSALKIVTRNEIFRRTLTLVLPRAVATISATTALPRRSTSPLNPRFEPSS